MKIDSKSVALREIEKDYNNYKYLSYELKDDIDVAKYALSCYKKDACYFVFNDFSTRLKSNIEINVLAAETAPEYYGAFLWYGMVVCAAYSVTYRNYMMSPDRTTWEYGNREFHIELKLLMENKYNYTIFSYQNLSKEDALIERERIWKEQLTNARTLYCAPKGQDKIIHLRFDHTLAESYLYDCARELREEKRPFSCILDLIDSKINSLEQMMKKYVSSKERGSFPERYMDSLLRQLDVEYYREKVFPWSLGEKETGYGTKRYDFYIPKSNSIIEVHGEQHYYGSFEDIGGRTRVEEQANDAFKEKIALDNGITNYIVVDARKSNGEYIKESIKKNRKFGEIFDLTNVNWNQIAFEASYGRNGNKSMVEFPIFKQEITRLNELKRIVERNLLPEDDYIPETVCSLKTDIFGKHPEIIAITKLFIESERGLLPNEILALKECERYQRKPINDEFPNKWKYLGIQDLYETYEKLLKLGFVKEAEIKKTIEKTNLIELKEFLAEQNDSCKASKAEMVKYIIEKYDEEFLKESFQKRYYQLTELGKAEIDDNSYVERYDNTIYNLLELNQEHIKKRKDI